MKAQEIEILVKNLEPYFHGFSAKENILTNSLGLKLSFQVSWNNKTKVVGIGGKYNHSIGCSFTKPIEKIANDIKRRLLPGYREDYINYKKEQREQEERKRQDSQL